MLRNIMLLALLLGADAVQAETNVCTSITTVPYVITTPGQYCLAADFTVGPSADVNVWAISIQAADVVLDCNDHSLSGPAPDPSGQSVNYVNGIILEGTARTTVRNCRINGFGTAIALGTTPQYATNLLIEDNRISGAGHGIVGTAVGVTRIRRNAVLDGYYSGVIVRVRDGTGEFRDNYISRNGVVDAPPNFGTAFWLRTQGTNSRVFVTGNTIAEVLGVPGSDSWAAVMIDPGSNVTFVENIVSAPANPANQGVVKRGIMAFGTVQVECHGNVFVGYGGEGNNAPCAAANNRMY